MFELFADYIRSRDYSAAGGILSALGRMVQTPAEFLPSDFCDAQVRVLPMDHALLIFIAVKDVDTFWAVPGDMVSAVQDNCCKLLSKRIVLSDLFSPDCRTPIEIHFLHTQHVPAKLVNGEVVVPLQAEGAA